MSRTAPLWLAHRSRFAGQPPQRARWLLALLAALMLASLTALIPPVAPPAALESGVAGAERIDELFYEAVIEDLRHGADYYVATASALRAAGLSLHPFTAFRLPTLAVVQSWSSPVVTALLLYGLGLLTLLAWWFRLADAVPRIAPRALATSFAAVGVAGVMRGDLVSCPEMWAGILVALSLAARRPGRWTTAAALGMSAMLISEMAALYVAIMAALAALDADRREAAGWLALLATFAIIMFFHAGAVAGVVRPLDQPAAGWTGPLGFGFGIRAMILTTGLSLAPAAIAAVAAGLTLAGWAAWRDPLATRVLAVMLAYLVCLSFFAHGGSAAWAYLIAPIAPIGLAFLPDAIRDLARPALDRRRITVTRTMR